MIGQLRMAGKISESTAMIRGCLSKITPCDEEYGLFHHELAFSLKFEDQPKEELDSALKIDSVGSVGDMWLEQSREMKVGVLALIDGKCTLRETKWLEVKEGALRAYLRVKLHKLGALRCKLQDFDEGVRFLEKAVERGLEDPRLSEELELACKGTYLEESTCDPYFKVIYHHQPQPNWRQSASN